MSKEVIGLDIETVGSLLKSSNKRMDWYGNVRPNI